MSMFFLMRNSRVFNNKHNSRKKKKCKKDKCSNWKGGKCKCH